MKRNKLKFNIFLFCFVFTLFFIKTKLTGNFGRISYGPISFKDTIDKIPEMLVFSVIVVILIYIAHKQVSKSEEKNTEAARKRIEEREKQEQQVKEALKDTKKHEEENDK